MTCNRQVVTNRVELRCKPPTDRKLSPTGANSAATSDLPIPGRILQVRSRAHLLIRVASPVRSIAAIALVLICLVVLSCSDGSAPPAEPDGEIVTIGRVTDGDTVELSDGRRVRYIGLNTPEYGQPYYDDATAANRKLVKGRDVEMVLGRQSTDRFGRLLAYFWVDGEMVNVELVRQGLANVYIAPPNDRYADLFSEAEQSAREAEIGIWAPSGVAIKIWTINYDAPGRDHENPNGEWVEILNEGSSAVQLVGFTLKDESNHIFVFPEVTLRPGQTLRIHSGRGQDAQGSVHWGLQGDAVWSNSGDTAYLRSPNGDLVDSYGY